MQDRPSMVVGWADIPELSTCVGCCSAAWLQSWLQSRRNGADHPTPSGFKSICDSVSTSAVTWVFSGYVHRAAHDHPVYIPCGLCGGARVIFWREPDASAGGVEDQLSVDVYPRFADPVHRPLADEPQRPGRGQRPHPPPKELRVRGAATTARLQDRPCGFRVTAWPSADGLAAIGELNADREILSSPRLRLSVSGVRSSSRPGVPGRIRRIIKIRIPGRRQISR